MGESNVGLSSEWIRKQITDGILLPTPSGLAKVVNSWANFKVELEVREADPIKTVLSPEDYDEVSLLESKSFFLEK